MSFLGHYGSLSAFFRAYFAIYMCIFYVYGEFNPTPRHYYYYNYWVLK